MHCAVPTARSSPIVCTLPTCLYVLLCLLSSHLPLCTVPSIFQSTDICPVHTTLHPPLCTVPTTCCLLLCTVHSGCLPFIISPVYNCPVLSPTMHYAHYMPTLCPLHAHPSIIMYTVPTRCPPPPHIRTVTTCSICILHTPFMPAPAVCSVPTTSHPILYALCPLRPPVHALCLLSSCLPLYASCLPPTMYVHCAYMPAYRYIHFTYPPYAHPPIYALSLLRPPLMHCAYCTPRIYMHTSHMHCVYRSPIPHYMFCAYHCMYYAFCLPSIYSPLSVCAVPTIYPSPTICTGLALSDSTMCTAPTCSPPTICILATPHMPALRYMPCSY
jgi:hypothetical protein